MPAVEGADGTMPCGGRDRNHRAGRVPTFWLRCLAAKARGVAYRAFAR